MPYIKFHGLIALTLSLALAACTKALEEVAKTSSVCFPMLPRAADIVRVRYFYSLISTLTFP